MSASHDGVRDLRLTIERQADGQTPLLLEVIDGVDEVVTTAEGHLRLDEADLRAATLDARAYGTILGRAVVADEALLYQVVQARADASRRVRIHLIVREPRLRALHWERLCLPPTWDHLALNQQTPFALVVPSVASRRFPAIGRRDLRALALVAAPRDLDRYGLAAFDAAAAVDGIQTALASTASGAAAPIPLAVLATTAGASGPPTLDALIAHLTTTPTPILHLVCHGQAGLAGEDGSLYLATADNQVAAIMVDQLIARLNQLGPGLLPYLVVLASCESASPAATTGFGHLAERLVRELGIPAVVAMTGSVSIATAQALSPVFYRQLRQHGEIDRALVEATAGLASRADVQAVVPVLVSRLGRRPLFSDQPGRPLSAAEIQAGLTEVLPLIEQRAPILHPETIRQATVLERLDLATRQRLSQHDPAGADPRAWKEGRDALASLDGLCQEVLDRSFAALAQGTPPPADDGRCPFRGLTAFQPEDRAFFFGRETWVTRLHDRLRAHPFLAVLGASGSGKSSLVLAGLVPALQQQTPDRPVAVFTPGADPMARLEHALAGLSNQPGLLVVDQFEELFTYPMSAEQRQRFLEQLLALTEQHQVVLTMRADFWGECAPYPALRAAMQAHQELVPALTIPELGQAMARQAEAVGLRFEGDLCETILDDVAGEPGAMPLVQHALLELWRRRHGPWLRAEEYRAIGGVAQAIAHTANILFASVTSTEQTQMRDIFLRLTRLDDVDRPSNERRDTSRRVALSELIPAGSAPAATRALVARLADARLVVTSHDTVSHQERVEVAHEALIRHWPRLREWLDTDAVAQRLRERIRQAAYEWTNAGRHDPSWLVHRGNQLAQTRELHLPLNADEQAYLAACQALEADQQTADLAAAQRLAAEAEARLQAESAARQEADQRAAVQTAAARTLRRFVMALAIAGIITLGLAIFARLEGQRAELAASDAIAAQRTAEAQSQARATAEIVAQQQRDSAGQAATAAISAQGTAEAQRTRADQERLTAQSRGLAALALVTLSTDIELGLLIAIEALRQSPTLQAREAVIHILSAPGLVRSTMRGHTDRVWSAAFSPDGQRVVTASADGTARVWEAGSGRELATLAGHMDIVRSAAFSPDGRRVVTASDDRTARVWEANSGRELVVLRGHTDTVVSAAFSPDGSRVVTASGNPKSPHEGDRTARVWEVSTGRELVVLRGHEALVHTAFFSPDGSRVVTASEAGVRVWEVSNWQQVANVVGHENTVFGAVSDVKISLDGRRLVTVGLDRTARVWDANTGHEIVVLNGDHDTGHELVSASFSPDGSRVVTAGLEGTTRVWDASSGRQLTVLQGHAISMTDASYSPDGRWVITISDDGAARTWDVRTGQSLAMLSGSEHYVTSAAFSPDGSQVLTISWDQTARVWEAGSGRELAGLAGHTDKVVKAAFSPDGSQVVTANADRTARVWEGGTGRELAVLRGHTDAVYSAAFSPDGSRVVTASADRTAWVWETGSGRHLATLTGHTAEVVSAAFSPDGSRVVTASADRTARVWEAGSGRALATLTGHADGVVNAVFSPDGSRVATAGQDGTARVWEAGTGRMLAVLRGHTNPLVVSVAFSSDGRRLVTASEDGTARVWEVISGRQLAVLDGKNSIMMVYSAAFSPDGQRVVTAMADGTARIWDANSGSELAMLRGHARSVVYAEFSSNGHVVVTASNDQTARLWEATTGRQLAVLRGHEGVQLCQDVCTLMNARFSPNGAWVVTTGVDETARVWKCFECMSVDRLLATARDYVTRELSCEERRKYVDDAVVCPTLTRTPNNSR